MHPVTASSQQDFRGVSSEPVYTKNIISKSEKQLKKCPNEISRDNALSATFLFHFLGLLTFIFFVKKKSHTKYISLCNKYITVWIVSPLFIVPSYFTDLMKIFVCII